MRKSPLTCYREGQVENRVEGMGGMGFRPKWRNLSWKRGGEDEKRTNGCGANFIGLVLASRGSCSLF